MKKITTILSTIIPLSLIILAGYFALSSMKPLSTSFEKCEVTSEISNSDNNNSNVKNVECNQNNTEQTALVIKQTQEFTAKVNSIEEEYALSQDNSTFKINKSIMQNNYIKCNDFIAITGDTITQNNILTHDDFTFNLICDNSTVKNINNQIYFNLPLVASSLGYSVQEEDTAYLLSRKFASRRLCLNTGASFDTYGATQTANYNDTSVLQYQTEYQAYLAYNKYEKANLDVVLDQVVALDQNEAKEDVDNLTFSSWDGALMGLDAYKNYLKQTQNNLNDVVVAVLDTGINTNHFLFKNRISEYSINMYDSRQSYEDFEGHGSHVASTIAGYTNSNVKILAIKITTERGCFASLTTISRAINYVCELADSGVNIKVINLSFGASTHLRDLSWQSTVFTRLRTRDIACCVASGNESANTKYNELGSSYEDVFLVGAIDKNKTVAKFSNYGKSLDFVAPGVEILGALPSSSFGLCKMSGTSMAAPHIAAACALLYSNAQKNYTYSEMEKVLKTDCICDLGDAGFDEYYGYGYCDLSKLININPVKTVNVIAKLDYGSGLEKFKNEEFGHYYISGGSDSTSFELTKDNNNFASHSMQVCNCITLCATAIEHIGFKGWYVGESEDNLHLVTTNLMTTINNFSNTIYITPKIDLRLVKYNVVFNYIDVVECTGFASYKTQLTYKYTAANNQNVVDTYTSGYKVGEGVVSFYAVYGTQMELEFLMQNDSKISGIFYDYYIEPNLYTLYGITIEQNGKLVNKYVFTPYIYKEIEEITMSVIVLI